MSNFRKQRGGKKKRKKDGKFIFTGSSKGCERRKGSFRSSRSIGVSSECIEHSFHRRQRVGWRWQPGALPFLWGSLRSDLWLQLDCLNHDILLNNNFPRSCGSPHSTAKLAVARIAHSFWEDASPSCGANHRRGGNEAAASFGRVGRPWEESPLPLRRSKLKSCRGADVRASRSSRD